MKQARIPSVYASSSFIPPTKSPKGDAILRRGCGVVIGQIPGPAAGHARGRSVDTGSYHAGHTQEWRGGRRFKRGHNASAGQDASNTAATTKTHSATTTPCLTAHHPFC